MDIEFGERKTAARGSALLVSLLMVTLITVLILAVTAQSQLERQLSATHLAEQQARSFTQMGLDTALSRIRETLAPFDDPFGSTNRPTNFWSLSPGRIDLFDFAPNAAGRPNRSETIPLHSGYPVADPNDAANLNAPDSYGRRPIWSENRKMEVEWVFVGRNPSAPVSATNPLAGRFAFWVDDEGSKINVNTADGSDNYTLSSYGQGTPTAVSLSVFSDLGDSHAPDRETVRAIAAEARRKPFAALSEMAARKLSLTHPVTSEVAEKTVSAKFPATNAFNLTTYSRSPDFNVFNLPRFQLVPSNMTNLTQLAGVASTPWTAAFIPVNRMIHYPRMGYWHYLDYFPNDVPSALRSLYPGPNQLSTAWKTLYPIMPGYPTPWGTYTFSYYQLVTSTAKRNAAGGTFAVDREALFFAMQQMENYLIGQDPFGNSIRWPFRDSNYLDKYNLRQLDSITLQTFEMGRSVFLYGGSDDAGGNNEQMMVPMIAPYGILGDQPVGSAVGRWPRLSRVLAKYNLNERAPILWRKHKGDIDVNEDGAINDLDKYSDENNDGKIDDNDRVYDGANLNASIMFSLYLPRPLYETDNYVDGRYLDVVQWAWTNQQVFGWNSLHFDCLNETDWVYGKGSLANPVSCWMDTLLYAEASEGGGYEPGNSSGIDFFGNKSNGKDPDSRALSLRREEYRRVNVDTTGTNATWVEATQAWGSGPNPSRAAPLLLYDVLGVNPYSPGPVAGLSQNFANNNGSMNYRTRNRGEPVQKIRLRGGVTMRLNLQGFMVGLTPLDNIAGPLYGGTNNPLALTRTGPAPLTNAVVPIFGKDGLELPLDQTRYVVARLRDPLVGQLPGDWVVKVYSSKPTPVQTANARVFDVAPGWWTDSALKAGSTAYDYLPEPEWVDLAAESGSLNLQSGILPNDPSFAGSGGMRLMPSLVNGTQKITLQSAGSFDNAAYLNTAKQRNFPSVGHLQYIRTGAMPDNPGAQIGDADYAGMPFRCLNFGPANTQGGIPDWALLDLFMVPNAIWTLPSTRLAYPRIVDKKPPFPELIQLTYGGASTGKINLNGSVLWPWVEGDETYIRPLPLAAQFNGLRYNRNGQVQRTFALSSTDTYVKPGEYVPRVQTSTNSWAVLGGPAAKALGEAIADYIRQNGPLALPGQMCDIPAVNAYGAQIPTTLNGESLLPPNSGFYGPGIPSPDGFNRTRNDIVSQSIGNLVTQGNVFSVWVTGQSIRKSAASDPVAYEPEKGDRVVAQTRVRFLIERKLDPGVDGIYGNAKQGDAGQDGIIGTPDDKVNTDYNPANPKFIYQVLSAQEVW